MITYNPNYLDNIDIFTSNEIKLLEELNQKVSLEKFLNNKSYIDKFGLCYKSGYIITFCQITCRFVFYQHRKLFIH